MNYRELQGNNIRRNIQTVRYPSQFATISKNTSAPVQMSLTNMFSRVNGKPGGCSSCGK